MSLKREPFAVKYAVANPISRLINYIIDIFLLSTVSFLIFYLFDQFGISTKERSFPITFFIMTWYFVYYVGFEYQFSKTPGKFITRTIVVKDDGQKPDLKTIIIRTFCRLIPFDQFSFLIGSEGWHDRFSETIVVKRKKVESQPDDITKHLISK